MLENVRNGVLSQEHLFSLSDLSKFGPIGCEITEAVVEKLLPDIESMSHKELASLLQLASSSATAKVGTLDQVMVKQCLTPSADCHLSPSFSVLGMSVL